MWMWMDAGPGGHGRQGNGLRETSQSGKDTTDRTGEAPKSTGSEGLHQTRETVCVCVWEREMEKGGKGHLNE